MLNVKILDIEMLKAYMTSEGENIQEYFFSIILSSEIFTFDIPSTEGRVLRKKLKCVCLCRVKGQPIHNVPRPRNRYVNQSGFRVDKTDQSGLRVNKIDQSGSRYIKNDQSGSMVNKINQSGSVVNKIDQSGSRYIKTDQSGSMVNKINQLGSMVNKIDQSGLRYIKTDQSGSRSIKLTNQVRGT